MFDILNQITAGKRMEVTLQKQQTSIDELLKKAEDAESKRSFKEALLHSSTGIIAEFKRKSPSKGWICEHAKPEDIVSAYAQQGASAISVLTDTAFFGGTFADFESARRFLPQTPLLRKDFMVDEYQLYQAKAMKADVILLIASVLTPLETKHFAAKAKELGMEVLLEIHNEAELGHINEYTDVVGVNNRNLGSFVTDVQISFNLSDKIPAEFIRISESGISDFQTVLDLRQAGFKGFLMGENFMKTPDPGKALGNFINQLEGNK